MTTLLDFTAGTATGLGGETLSGQQIVDALTATRATKTIVNPGSNIDLDFEPVDVAYRVLVSADIVVNIANGQAGHSQNMRLIFQIPFGKTPKISFGSVVTFPADVDLASYAASGVLCVDVHWDGVAQNLSASIVGDGGSSVVAKDQSILALEPDIWLDAGVGVTVSADGSVSSWDSKLGDTVVSAGTGAVTLSQAALNNRPSLSFPGTAALKFSYPNIPGTIIAVYRNTTCTSSKQPAICSYDNDMAGPSWALRGYIPMGVGGGYARAQGYQIGTVSEDGAFSAQVSGAHGHWQVLGGSYSGDTVCAASGHTHSTPCLMPLNAGVLQPGGAGGAIGAAYDNTGAFTDFFEGDICEILIWDRKLTQREYSSVVRALQKKYDLEPVFGNFLYAAFQPTETGGETGGIEGLVLLSSDDGVEFKHVPTNLIFDSGHTMRDPSITFYNGWYIIACTASSFYNGHQDRFSIYRSRDARQWEFVTDVIVAVDGVSSHQTWAPEFYHNAPDGVLRLVVHGVIGNTADQPYEMHALDDTLLNWSDPVLLSLGYSDVIDTFPFYYSGTWVLYFKDNSTSHIQIATATSPIGPYTVLTSGDWAGWGGQEGPSIMPLGINSNGDTMLRCYFDANGYGIRYSDAVGKWPAVLTGTYTALQTLDSPAPLQHGTCIRNPMPNFGA